MALGSINYDPAQFKKSLGGATSGGSTPTTPQQPQGYQQLNTVWNALLSSAAPGIANSNAQVGNLQGQLGQVAANQGYQSGLINQDYNQQLASLGIQQQGLGIQQGALARQSPLLQQQNQLNTQLLDIQGQSLGAAGSSAIYNNTRANQNLTGQTAAQGAINTKGYTQNKADLAQQLSDTMGNIGRGEQQLDINRQQQGLNYGEQQASLQDQQKNLDLTSKQLGINAKDLEIKTNQALAQLGLQTTLSTGDIYNGILNAQRGVTDALSPVIGTIVQYIMTQKVGG